MADIFVRMRQLIGSSGEWAANNIVLGDGELGIERVSASEYKMKCGDGSTRWASLPYISEAGLTTAIQAALNGKLNIAGGTMTGSLVLSKDATAPKEPVTLTQLNNEKTRIDNALATKLPLAGGTLTGPLTLAADAVSALQPVSYGQLSTELANRLAAFSNGITFVGNLDPTAAYRAPTPPPVNGNLYAVNASGAVNPSWVTHISGTAPANVNVGDQLIWSAADNAFHYFPSATSGGAASDHQTTRRRSCHNCCKAHAPARAGSQCNRTRPTRSARGNGKPGDANPAGRNRSPV
jgi:hypothetical protein